MALIHKLYKIARTTDFSDDNIYKLTKRLLLDYKREQEQRLTYNLKFNDTIRNRHQLSISIKIDGLSTRAIDGRIYNSIKHGFKPNNENKELTDCISKILKISTDDLVVNFPIKTTIT